MANWFVSMAGTEQGPFSDRQLKQLASEGRLSRLDIVRREDQQKGCEAQKLKGLFETPPPLPSPTPQQAQEMPLQPPQIQVQKRTQPTIQSKSVLPKVAIGCGAALLLFVLSCAGLGVIGNLLNKNKRPDLSQVEEKAEKKEALDEEATAIRLISLLALKAGKGRNHWTPEEFTSMLRHTAKEFGAGENPTLKHLLTIEPTERKAVKDEKGAGTIGLLLRFGEQLGDKATTVLFRNDPDGYHLMTATIDGRTYFIHKDTGALLIMGDSGLVKVND